MLVSAAMRPAISVAALLVKVTASMLDGRAPLVKRRSKRLERTRVLPLPGGAKTRMNLSSEATAALCAPSRPSRRISTAAPAGSLRPGPCILTPEHAVAFDAVVKELVREPLDFE